jgi:ferrochelatase
MSVPERRIGVIVINFGEPNPPVPDQVQAFLERIFLQNAGLEPSEEALKRTRQLARDRTPGLVKEYQAIGGSPLNRQADQQAQLLSEELARRGWDVRTYSAFQYTEPFIAEKVDEARYDGVEVVVALPLYPICGQSTTVAALQDVRLRLDELGWVPEYVGVSGWHHHPGYVEMRTEHIRTYVEANGLDLTASDTLLYFSVHGTPLKYLDEGNRYDRYVDEQCRSIAQRLGADRYGVGFQNHTNRRIQWTQPENEDRIRGAEEERLVVVPISFMHEQSETLAELDHELRDFVEELGKEFYRVPVPHDEPAFIAFLGDLVAQLVSDPEGGAVRLASCRCAPLAGVRCTNGHRELPQSPYAAPVEEST